LHLLIKLLYWLILLPLKEIRRLLKSISRY
jgi:hypothetical protein